MKLYASCNESARRNPISFRSDSVAHAITRIVGCELPRPTRTSLRGEFGEEAALARQV